MAEGFRDCPLVSERSLLLFITAATYGARVCMSTVRAAALIITVVSVPLVCFVLFCFALQLPLTLVFVRSRLGRSLLLLALFVNSWGLCFGFRVRATFGFRFPRAYRGCGSWQHGPLASGEASRNTVYTVFYLTVSIDQRLSPHRVCPTDSAD